MTVVSRVVAVVLAVGLVLVALGIRERRDVGGVPDGQVAVVEGDTAVLCPREWQTLCIAAAPGATAPGDAAAVAALLEDDDASVAVLPSAWADLVDDARTRAGRPALARSAPLASTPLLLVAFADRAAVLADACGTTAAALDWACVGEHAGTPWADLGGDVRWGSVTPGHLPPTDASGLLATAAVVGARTGTPFALAELRDVAFTSWFTRVQRAVPSFRPPGGSHLTAMVTRGPSAANVAVASEAELVTRGTETAFGDLVVAAPSPLYDLELVVVGVDGDAVEEVADQVDVDALADAGWRTGDSAPSGAPLPDLPARTAPPSGGVLTALVAVWEDVAG